MSDDEYFYDRVYEAWRSGRDSDLVSRERWDYARGHGYQPEEIGLDMLMPREPVRPEPEPEWPEPEWPEPPEDDVASDPCRDV